MDLILKVDIQEERNTLMTEFDKISEIEEKTYMDNIQLGILQNQIACLNDIINGRFKTVSDIKSKIVRLTASVRECRKDIMELMKHKGDPKWVEKLPDFYKELEEEDPDPENVKAHPIAVPRAMIAKYKWVLDNVIKPEENKPEENVEPPRKTGKKKK